MSFLPVSYKELTRAHNCVILIFFRTVYFIKPTLTYPLAACLYYLFIGIFTI